MQRRPGVVKRAPIVIAGTVAGLIGVLEFHTTPASLTMPSTPAAAASGRASSGPTPSGHGSTPAGNAAGGNAQAGSASPQQAPGRTAVGPVVYYNFGTVSVRVTVSQDKIVKIGIASLNDGNNPRSQYIDQEALPLLEQQAMQAQSANIQGVSGASYTSAGFARSLQGALHTLGIA